MLGTENQKLGHHTEFPQTRYTNEENRSISSNYRKIHRIFVLTNQYHANMEAGFAAVDQHLGAIAYDYFHAASKLLKQIAKYATDYDGQPYTTLDIEKDMAEMRGRARKINAFAARLGITPAELLEIQMRGVLPC